MDQVKINKTAKTNIINILRARLPLKAMGIMAESSKPAAANLEALTASRSKIRVPPLITNRTLAVIEA